MLLVGEVQFYRIIETIHQVSKLNLYEFKYFILIFILPQDFQLHTPVFSVTQVWNRKESRRRNEPR